MLGARDEPGVAQHVEMLHDGGQLERQWACDFRDGQARLPLEAGEDGPPRGVHQRGKRTIELTDRRLHHVVNYRDSARGVKVFYVYFFSELETGELARR